MIIDDADNVEILRYVRQQGLVRAVMVQAVELQSGTVARSAGYYAFGSTPATPRLAATP